MRRPDETNRRPTWLSPEEAKRRLAKGREVKYFRELEAVIDRALETNPVPPSCGGVSHPAEWPRPPKTPSPLQFGHRNCIICTESFRSDNLLTTSFSSPWTTFRTPLVL